MFLIINNKAHLRHSVGSHKGKIIIFTKQKQIY